MEVKSNFYAEVLAGRSEVPEWVLILPAGELHTADGLRFVVDQEAMDDILAAFERRQVDMVIDYEHQTQRGEEAPAAGWIKELRADAAGVWARVEWTERGRRYVERREYRYLSPVILVDRKSGRVREIVSVALTNIPRINRFIPARTGNTGCGSARFAPGPVHPRAYGEHQPSSMPIPRPSGSSPRVRGTPKRWRHGPGGGRFIPARTGNTCWWWTRTSGWPVHPRAYGEHDVRDRRGIYRNGSSPRVRGTRSGVRQHQQDHRFIPARTGNTSAARVPNRSQSVHPRAYGEHIQIEYNKTVRTGSSPRVRGTLIQAKTHIGWYRFIPARTGNTGGSGSRPIPSAVHPRAYGEHPRTNWTISEEYGSSPRVRGTLMKQSRD